MSDTGQEQGSLSDFYFPNKNIESLNREELKVLHPFGGAHKGAAGALRAPAASALRGRADAI